MGRVRNPDRGQLTAPMQPRQVEGIPPVRLDPIPRLAWDRRRRHHHTAVPRQTQLPFDAIAARTRLVAEPQLVPVPGQLVRQALQGRRSVRVGARLGPYEVQSPLGAGGMGEVYRARDTRLDPTVALKILPASLAARFPWGSLPMRTIR